ncbi:MAG: thiamine-phosphate kinase [Saprospiraceae bacterium]|nr:thiamine-phosphate kinase [Saprospiraceae bacterium]
MENEKRTEIATLGEFGLIDHLTRSFPLKNRESILGVGDDAALIDNQGQLTVVSTDLLLEGIHFDLMYYPLKHLGYKSIVVNLSDICAMNARPKQVTVSIGLSNRFSVEAVDELYAGIQAACDFYGVDLVGGDTSSSLQGLVISVTAIGQVTPEKKVLRSTAKVGDIICVTGDLGGAYLGLQILEREKQIFLNQPETKPDLEDQQYIVGRQLKPEARLDMIEQFEKSGVIPTAMIDISDGLASDLKHICKQSGVGAFIEESGVPIHPQSEQMALKFKLDPITCALSGGEDYELLFTIDPKDLNKVRVMSDIYMMGEIVDAKDGIKLHTKGGNLHDLTAQGWNHF